jgi:hypothetical protein
VVRTVNPPLPSGANIPRWNSVRPRNFLDRGRERRP